jgi:polyisoprenoid-binding protein YceI
MRRLILGDAVQRKLLWREIAMNRLLLPLIAAAALSAVPTAGRAQAAKFEIDPTHLSIGFFVEHIGYAKTLGMFLKAKGSFQFDEASGSLSNVQAEVETDSVFTNDKRRDSHVKGGDFLSADKHPRMLFTATAAKRTGDRTFEVPGQLELLGKSLPLTLTATWNKSAESPLPGKPYVMGVSLRGTVKRSAYGMNYAVANGWVGDDVAVMIEFEAIRR